MLSEADRAVLDESFQNTRMAGEAIHMVIGKGEDEDLALDLNRQACRFLQFEEKLQQMYAREHETPPRDHVVDKTMLWGGIQMNTLMDDSTEKLADMMIQGNTKGMTELMKTVKENRTAAREYCEIAKEIADFEEKNIEKLKAYLK